MGPGGIWLEAVFCSHGSGGFGDERPCLSVSPPGSDARQGGGCGRRAVHGGTWEGPPQPELPAAHCRFLCQRLPHRFNRHPPTRLPDRRWGHRGSGLPYPGGDRRGEHFQFASLRKAGRQIPQARSSHADLRCPRTDDRRTLDPPAQLDNGSSLWGLHRRDVGGRGAAHFGHRRSPARRPLLSALFGVVFFSHQIGASLGGWLPGRVFDATAPTSQPGCWRSDCRWPRYSFTSPSRTEAPQSGTEPCGAICDATSPHQAQRPTRRSRIHSARVDPGGTEPRIDAVEPGGVAEGWAVSARGEGLSGW